MSTRNVPFALPYSQAQVDDLRSRLRRTRWPDEIAGVGWEYGFPRDVLVDLCRYWQDDFDWQAQLARAAAFPHFRFENEGLAIHFLHARGKGPAPLPLILTHGWPGSFLEMLRIVPLLTDPAAHGGEAADAFDVVVPSLPGFGYSDKPSRPGMNAIRTADLWVELMSALDYTRFGAQGGDIGAAVSTALALHYPQRMIGLHLNYVPGSYRPWLEPGCELSTAEQSFLDAAASWREQNGGYSHIQATRPQTLAYVMNDSPAGLAAWMLEKSREWSDSSGDLYGAFDRDDLLSQVTLYWMTQTAGSSFRMYLENRLAPLHLRRGERITVPSGFAVFPREIFWPPREWVERGYNVQRWTPMPRGGHFAAAEQPELLAEDIRSFFRPLRG